MPQFSRPRNPKTVEKPLEDRDSHGRALRCAICGKKLEPADGWEVCSEECADEYDRVQRKAHLTPNRALSRSKLEAIAWGKTPSDYRGSSGSRREVLINTPQGTTLVPLSTLTDFQLRKYIGPGALEEAGDMQNNGGAQMTKTRWTDEMVLASVRDHEMLTPQARERAFELAEAGLIDNSGSWRLTALGHARLKEEGNMRSNGRGIYSDTAAQEDDYVIWRHGTNGLYYVDRVGPDGKAVKALGKPAASLKAAVAEARQEGMRRNYMSGLIFENRNGELHQIGQLKRGTGMDFEENAAPEAADETAARELSLYIENEYDLVAAPNSPGQSIEKNLLKKIKNGSFDLKLSEKAWMYLIEAGAKKYCKGETGSGAWNKIFTKPTRELVAYEFATSFYEEYKLGNKSLTPNSEDEDEAEDGLAAQGITVEEFDAPAHWASAFINGDTSGLEEEDLEEFEEWCRKHPDLGWVVSASEETHMGRFNGLQTDLCTYTAHVKDS